ncbi:MAG: ATP phosphoribosyltransferase regulatory subunit [Candidatus Symbiobacter sp.]|nr:ATP phosphoribosyltransferase regulatory subunit [Candidatus Symbiobacter sp.]
MIRNDAAKGLLPTGLGDVLPPMAAHRAASGESLLSLLAAHGYERVEPPLLDFAENLPGVDSELRAFHLSDPTSGRRLVLRADITPQIGRIAQTRLGNAPRPLRLSYGGTVIRVKGSQLSPDRQFTQIGAELIGVESPAADIEVIRLAFLGLARLGLQDVTCDFTLPRLVPEIMAHYAQTLPDAVRAALLEALRHKDAGQVKEVLSDQTDPSSRDLAFILSELFKATGPMEAGLAALTRLAASYGAVLSPYLGALNVLVPELAQLLPPFALTLDPLEHSDFDYHSALQFNLFSGRVQGELASGGRYYVGAGQGVTHQEKTGEPAIGFTWYLEKIFPLLPPPTEPKRIYLPPHTPWAASQSLHDRGFVTVNGLALAAATAFSDCEPEARRLRCQFIYWDDKVVAVKPS